MCLIEISPVIETRRLKLRAPEDRDLQRISDFASDYDIARMTLRMPHPYRFEHAVDFLTTCVSQDRSRDNTFVIELEDEGAIGAIGLFHAEDPFPEVGYWIARPYWGRGFATEALEASLRWASKSWGKKIVVAGHFADNPASGEVLTKAGFLYTGEVRRQRSLARGEAVETRRMLWMA